MTATDPQQSIDHLDFDTQCYVGKPGGVRNKFMTSEAYPPCTEPAVFVTDIHGHDEHNRPEDHNHYWCAKHLAEHTVAIQTWLASIEPPARPYCRRCNLFFNSMTEMIYNLNMLE